MVPSLPFRLRCCTFSCSLSLELFFNPPHATHSCRCHTPPSAFGFSRIGDDSALVQVISVHRKLLIFSLQKEGFSSAGTFVSGTASSRWLPQYPRNRSLTRDHFSFVLFLALLPWLLPNLTSELTRTGLSGSLVDATLISYGEEESQQSA